MTTMTTSNPECGCFDCAHAERIADDAEALAHSRGCPTCGLAVREPDADGRMACTDPWCDGGWTEEAREQAVHDENNAAKDDAYNPTVDALRDDSW